MSTAGKGTLLLVEDEAPFRRVYKDMLESAGYNVLLAEDGERAWQLAQSKKPDLILLDLLLPKLDGRDVLKNIRANEETRDIPVIVFTVLGDPESIREGLALGANDYTVKGLYTPLEILGKIRALLTQKDFKRRVPSYNLFMKETKGDAAQLEHVLGLLNLLKCPHCNEELALELLPDYTRADGNWFSTHFICPKCHRGF